MNRTISPALSDHLRQLAPSIETTKLTDNGKTLEVTCREFSSLPPTVEFEGTVYNIINTSETALFTPHPSAFCT